MDFDLRQWLMLVGPIIIIGVLFHGYLRMRASQNEIKMEIDKTFESLQGDVAEVDELSLLKAELPNGGSRLVTSNETEASIEAVGDMPGLSVNEFSSSTRTELGHTSEEVCQPNENLGISVFDGSKEPLATSGFDAEEPEMFVVINILAVNEPFDGQALLEFLLESEMTFGEMNIFHRISGDEVCFSLANAESGGLGQAKKT